MRLLATLCALSCLVAVQAQALPRRAMLGFGLAPVPEDQRTNHSLKPGQGAVASPGPDGKLNGDVKAGDIVLEIDGKGFASGAELNEIVRGLKAGAPVKVKVLEDGKPQTRTITPIERPRDKGDNYEVIYDHVVSSGNRIRTFVSKPKATGKRPVFFWIQGINTGSVDQPLTGQGITSKILKSFSDDGWVTVRVEKTGVGDSEGGPALKVGFDEELDIYRQALKSLDKYDFVDRSRVYIFGHSMGGCHAPIVASELPVKGIISYGTVSDSWLEWQIKASRFQAMLGGGDPAQIDQMARQTVLFYNELYNEKKSIEQIAKDHPHLADYIKQASPDGKEMLSVRSVQYMREVNDKNFNHYWARVGEAKVLALFGENDFVALETCQTQIPVVVNRSKPGNAKYVKVKESDHAFTKTASFEDSRARWGRPGNDFNPEIIRVCKEWIKSIEGT